MTHLPAMLDRLIAREGGFVNHPHDKGGATKYGITQATLGHWYSIGDNPKAATVDDVKNLSEAEAKAIYEKLYYYAMQVNKAPEEVQEILLDACVNHGGREGWRMMQLAINQLGYDALVVDGVCGAKTLAALQNTYEKEGGNLVKEYARQRLLKYDAIALHNPSQKVFLKGWYNRITGIMGAV